MMQSFSEGAGEKGDGGGAEMHCDGPEPKAAALKDRLKERMAEKIFRST